MNRRRFLHSSTAAALGFPSIIPGSALGKDGAIAPSNRIAMGFIGVGNRGSGNMRALLQDERVQAVAVCDVDTRHVGRALKTAGLEAQAGTGDFREVTGRKDIDAVMVATPDHWHALVTLAAARAGKDIYCEKPLTSDIHSGRVVCDTVKEHKRVLQCGTWRRSSIHTRMGCELVRNGYIGALKEIEVGVPGKFAIRGGYTGLEKPQEVPKELDYNLWLGPAPDAPYTAARCHFNFRWVNDYAPGYITDWGAHFIDVAHWGAGLNDSAPVEIEAREVKRREQGIYDAPESFDILYRYPGGLKIRMFSTTDTKRYGIKFIGEEGWVFSEHTRLETHPVELRKTKIVDGETRLYVSNHHYRNFIDCVISRERTASTAEASHRAATACHLGAHAAALGKPVSYDPVKELMSDPPVRQMRGEWAL